MSNRFPFPWTYEKTQEVRFDEKTGERREYFLHAVKTGTPIRLLSQLNQFISYPKDGENTEEERVARLIAAAPEMFEALKRFVREDESWAHDGRPAGCLCRHCEASAVLKKAEGKAE